ncbi:hypothetical protein ACFVYV_43505 [Streptomyces mirabilis]|uniref:hypothetical protein n=1 Tax=Streptomyces mirabilis TaxID=68239 RepID=UPI0036DB3F8E
MEYARVPAEYSVAGSNFGLAYDFALKALPAGLLASRRHQRRRDVYETASRAAGLAAECYHISGNDNETKLWAGRAADAFEGFAGAAMAAAKAASVIEVGNPPHTRPMEFPEMVPNERRNVENARREMNDRLRQLGVPI